MEEEPKFTITVENPDGDKLIMTVDEYAGVFDWGNKFRALLTWVTYQPDTISNLLKGEYEEDYE